MKFIVHIIWKTYLHDTQINAFYLFFCHFSLTFLHHSSNFATMSSHSFCAASCLLSISRIISSHSSRSCSSSSAPLNLCFPIFKRDKKNVQTGFVAILRLRFLDFFIENHPYGMQFAAYRFQCHALNYLPTPKFGLLTSERVWTFPLTRDPF